MQYCQILGSGLIRGVKLRQDIIQLCGGALEQPHLTADVAASWLKDAAAKAFAKRK